jgi:hypothetical protein
MHRATKRLLWGLALVFAFVLLWRKIRIVMFVHVTFWQLGLLFLGLALAIYLIMEVAVDKLRGR